MKTQNFSLRVLLLGALLFTTAIAGAQKLCMPTFYGGTTNGGTLVQMNPDGSSFTPFFSFYEANGSCPMGSVMQCSNGNLYGCCVNGGADSSCVIWCWNPDSGSYSNCWSFDITHGDFPMSGLTELPGGLLYGAASAGGALGQGVIYTYNPSTNTYTDLYELIGEGHNPCGKMLLASDGKLYGITSGYYFYGSSASGFGTIYRFDPSASAYTDLYAFAGVKDGYGFGSLIEQNGILYGMTSGLPQFAPSMMNFIFPSAQTLPQVNRGNIFSYNLADSTYTDLYDFDSVNGQSPYGTLLASNGKFYGMSSAGGTYNLGTIFSYDVATNTLTKLFDFNGTNGATPYGDLVQSTDGNLYGTTTAGGTGSLGVVFRFNPANNNYTVVQNFDGTNGSAPLGGAPQLVNTGVSGILSPVANRSLSAFPIPAHDFITVNLDAATGDKTMLTITDVNGRLVWGPEWPAMNANSEIQIDLSTLASGVYFLQATNGSGALTKKIVRQ